jgi:uncharacterized membrane protein
MSTNFWPALAVVAAAILLGLFAREGYYALRAWRRRQR